MQTNNIILTNAYKKYFVSGSTTRSELTTIARFFYLLAELSRGSSSQQDKIYAVWLIIFFEDKPAYVE